jgi:hypothetical protein
MGTPDQRKRSFSMRESGPAEPLTSPLGDPLQRSGSFKMPLADPSVNNRSKSSPQHIVQIPA